MEYGRITSYISVIRRYVGMLCRGVNVLRDSVDSYLWHLYAKLLGFEDYIQLRMVLGNALDEALLEVVRRYNRIEDPSPEGDLNRLVKDIVEEKLSSICKGRVDVNLGMEEVAPWERSKREVYVRCGDAEFLVLLYVFWEKKKRRILIERIQYSLYPIGE